LAKIINIFFAYISPVYTFLAAEDAGSDKLDNGDLRQDAYSAGVADESKTPVDIQFLTSFFIETCPLSVDVLYRAPFEAGDFHPELHAMGMAGKHKVYIRIFCSDLGIPVGRVMAH